MNFKTSIQLAFEQQFALLSLLNGDSDENCFDADELAKALLDANKEALSSNNPLHVKKIINDFQKRIENLNNVLNHAVEKSSYLMTGYQEGMNITCSNLIEPNDDNKTIDFINSLKEDWYNATTVAYLFGISDRQVRNWYKNGDLKKEKCTGQKVYSKKELIRVFRIRNKKT